MKLIVTSVIYHETAVFYGSLEELTNIMQQFNLVGEYTYQLLPQ